jgi:hypothetical protein
VKLSPTTNFRAGEMIRATRPPNSYEQVLTLEPVEIGFDPRRRQETPDVALSEMVKFELRRRGLKADRR